MRGKNVRKGQRDREKMTTSASSGSPPCNDGTGGVPSWPRRSAVYSAGPPFV